MAEWHLTPQAAAMQLTDEQLSVLVPAMTYRLVETSAITQLSRALATVPDRSGSSRTPGKAPSRPSPRASRHAGRTYGRPDQPLRGADLMAAVGAMARNGDAGRGRPS